MEDEAAKEDFDAEEVGDIDATAEDEDCLLYTSPSPRDS